MIKFFRKIRQRLLTENKFSKYVLYAMGEIALVMIGILLALQVNTWNEERKNQALEKGLLQEINEEFKWNLSEFEDNLIIYDIARNELNKIINSFPIDPQKINLDTLAVSFELLHFQGDFDKSTVAITKLKSTSSFDIISNEELRSLLIEWEVMAADYQITESQAIQFHMDVFAPMMYHKLSRPYAHGLKDPRVDLNFLRSLEFEGLMKFKFRKVDNLFRGIKGERNIVTTMERIIQLSENQ
jgi:hypothetical protein